MSGLFQIRGDFFESKSELTKLTIIYSILTDLPSNIFDELTKLEV